MPSTTRSGWGRAGHRRAVLVGALALAIVIGGGVAAWAEVSGGATDYRMATVTRADIGTTLTVVGDVAPVHQAAAAFQVGGKVATMNVIPGATVTAGETLGTLETTALSETVSSNASSLSADEAKLAEDEADQSGGSSTPNGSNGSTGTTGSTSTTTTTPSGHAGAPAGGGSGTTGNPTVAQDQKTLTEDESALSKEQQQEAADLAQAQTDCTSANTSTPAGQAACETALQTVSADEQAVSADQKTVSKDENALATALAAESSGGSGLSATGNSGAATGHALSSGGAGSTGNSGTGSGGKSNSGSAGTTPSSSSGGSSDNTDTPQQIASDQADIDTAQANLTEAQQALKEATLTSPIDGTVVSVALNVGDTVSAGSSTAIITILGTNSYEAEATLDSAQIPSVKVGQSARVEVDGVNGTIEGTVSQVGPVQSSSSGYSYPVVVAFPSTTANLYPGSTANVLISTGQVSDVVAVPTSAVQTLGMRSYVTELSKGELTRKFVKVGMVGDSYAQVLSGLFPGQHVVLVDYAEPVPSSNSNTNLGNFLGGGGGGFPGGGFFGGGGGTFRINRVGNGGGAFPGG